MPEGEAILLLHGFSNTHRAWARLRGAGLASAGRIVTPDLRGHGVAGTARPVSLTAVLDDLAAIVTAAPEIRWTLGGYSQGGRIALHAALDARIAPRLARLVLISASPGLEDAQARAERRAADEALAAALETMTIEAFADRWERTPVLAGLAPALAAEARADRLHNTPAGLAAALRGLGTGALPSLWGRLGELTVPVTLIAGERDAKFVAVARAMARALDECTVAVIEQSGHQVHLEAPAAIVSLVTPA